MAALVTCLRRPLVLLLLIALVYQVGTCPCGCWDESIWRTVIVGVSSWLDTTACVASSDTGPTGAETKLASGAASRSDGTAMSAMDGHECDELPKISQRDERAPRAANSTWRCLPTPSPTFQRSTLLAVRTTGNRIHVETSAEARALLQVFLL